MKFTDVKITDFVVVADRPLEPLPPETEAALFEQLRARMDIDVAAVFGLPSRLVSAGPAWPAASPGTAVSHPPAPCCCGPFFHRAGRPYGHIA